MTLDPETQAKAEQELVVERDDGILRLTINRPESSNSIPYYVRDGLIAQFRAAHADASIRCVVLTAAGERHFCTGSDLRIRPPMAPKPEGAPDMPRSYPVNVLGDNYCNANYFVQYFALQASRGGTPMSSSRAAPL